MRRMVIIESVTLGLLALALLLSFGMPERAQMLIYPLVRQAAQAKTEYQTRHMLVYETTHFRIKYTEIDADTVAMVADAAERAYSPVTGVLSVALPGKQLVVIYPTRSELNKIFGWSGDQSAMGVYWGGVIQVLSPHAWLKQDSAEEFVRSGPMAHELTHLVLDYQTSGNYPRWFTEGLAQYVEYRANGYEWVTSTNSLRGATYSMDELNDRFDELPNQALAYRQSLAAVRFIAETGGDQGLRAVIGDLKAGRSLKTAIERQLGMDMGQFDSAWREWAKANMQ